jgi:hypothetical protein
VVFSLGTASGNYNDTLVDFDMNFRLTPLTTSTVLDEVVWDMIFWSDTTLTFDMYYREMQPDGTWENKWDLLVEDASFITTDPLPTVGLSLASISVNRNFEKVNEFTLDREYGIVIKKIGSETNRSNWSDTVDITIVPVASDAGSLGVLNNRSLTPEKYAEHQAGIYAVKEIGVPTEYQVSRPFKDQNAPTFIEGYPVFEPGDSGVNIDIMLSRGNTRYYYVITEVENIPTTITKDGKSISIKEETWEELPETGQDLLEEGEKSAEPNATAPSSSSITNSSTYSSARYVVGNGTYSGTGVQTISILNKLEADKDYVAYFVLQGESAESISQVYAFRFKTEKVVRPILRVSLSNPSATVASVGANPKEAEVKYLMIVVGQEHEYLKQKMGASTIWNDNAVDDYEKLTEDKKKEYQDMTVLDAMCTQVTTGSTSLGTVFDLYAQESAKEEIAGWIETASSNGTSIVATGDLSLTTGSLNQSVNCLGYMNKDNSNINYWFVAMGKTFLGSSYAFSASGYLYYPDTASPQVITLSTSVTDTSDLSQVVTEAYKTSYSGTVSVVFSKDLYYRTNSTVYKQVVDRDKTTLMGEQVGTLPATNTYVSSEDLITTTYNESTGKGIKIQHKNTTANDYSACYALIIEFNEVTPNTTIAFSQNLSSERGFTGTVPLVLTMDLVVNKDGFYVPQFKVASSGWGDPTVY